MAFLLVIAALVPPDIGIHGNSHMMMQDRSNLQVAGVLDDWMGHHTGRKP